MRVRAVAERPFAEIPYLNAARGGGVEQRTLPVLRVTVDVLPPGLEAVVATSDLQGRDLGDEARLLGVAVAEHLSADLLDADRIGVCLCGDLYTVPDADRRGGTGDVSTVWEAFAARFRWVAGVEGNHDVLPAGGLDGVARAHLLDGEVRTLDGLRVGGVGGIVGALHRHNRKQPAELAAQLRRVLAGAPDVLLLHEGPPAPAPVLRGNPDVGTLLAAAAAGGTAPLVLCGHVPWPVPFAELPGGVQVLNLEARVAVLTAG